MVWETIAASLSITNSKPSELISFTMSSFFILSLMREIQALELLSLSLLTCCVRGWTDDANHKRKYEFCCFIYLFIIISSLLKYVWLDDGGVVWGDCCLGQAGRQRTIFISRVFHVPNRLFGKRGVLFRVGSIHYQS